jgi:phosphohistidine phosphatase
MKTLLLLRHAKSSWDSPASKDYDRPLAPRGERDAPRVGKALRDAAVDLDLVVSSPAMRARQTAERVLEAARYDGPVRYEEAIYEASVAELMGVVRDLPDKAETVMLVGHNPGFEMLLGALCGTGAAPARVRVPTAMLACVELATDRWKEVSAGSGALLWMVVPRMLA